MRADVKKCLVMIAMAAAVTGFAAGYPNYALNCEVFASSIELPEVSGRPGGRRGGGHALVLRQDG